MFASQSVAGIFHQLPTGAPQGGAYGRPSIIARARSPGPRLARARLRPTCPTPVRTQSFMAPSALGEPSLAPFEHLLGDERRSHRRRPAGVEREMGNDLAQFALFEPVVERALQVADQLLLAAERYQGSARDQAAVALGEAGALPYLPEQHPLAQIDEGRDDVADLVTR